MSPATLLAAAVTLVISTPVVLLLLLLLPFQRSANAKRKVSSTKRLPPGEMGWPVVGSTFAFLRPHRATALGDYMTQNISKYGRVFAARLFGRVSMVSADAELNRHVLNNDTRLFENAWPPHVPRLMGKHSTVMSGGDAHKQKKSIVLSFVSSARTQSSFVRGVEWQAAALVASWEGRDVVYGADEARKGRAYLRRTVEQKMEEKSRNKRKGVDEEEDFVDWMLKNTSYSTEEMIDMIQGLIFGGHHTTAQTLSLAFYFLARCPKAIKQMREERVRCLKSKSEKGGSNLTWDDYKDSEFTQNLKLLKNKDYYVIPQGTGVIVHLAAAHLDESVFEDPYEFNPWRWETLSDTKKASFMPFGGGLRLCPGRDLARMEIAIFLHTLIQNYNFELIGPDHPMAKPQVDFRNGLPIKLKP
ncbi:Cytochrome P450 90B1, partial [Ananas comosus]